MSIDLKMASLICKHVFYRQENNAKEEPHEVKFWSFWYVKTNRVQRVDEKNGVIFIMFPPSVMQYAH